MVARCIFLLVVVFAQAVMPRHYTWGRGLSTGRSLENTGEIGDCLPIDPFPTQLVQFALEEMDQGHTFHEILGIRTQFVAGTKYYLELLVSRSGTPSEGVICEDCDVQIVQQGWGDGPEFTLISQLCKKTCCRIQSNVLPFI